MRMISTMMMVMIMIIMMIMMIMMMMVMIMMLRFGTSTTRECWQICHRFLPG